MNASGPNTSEVKEETMKSEWCAHVHVEINLKGFNLQSRPPTIVVKFPENEAFEDEWHAEC